MTPADPVAANTATRGKGAPTKREIALASEIRDAARELADATNYAETYVARVRLNNAILALHDWMLAGRPAR